MLAPMVSVIIPTFNREHCLAASVKSALEQKGSDGRNYASLEVIVVDDGSTDQTREMLQKTFSLDPRFKYVYQANGGVSAARNRGLREARGEFIAFLDSDDIWLPGKLVLQIT